MAALTFHLNDEKLTLTLDDRDLSNLPTPKGPLAQAASPAQLSRTLRRRGAPDLRGWWQNREDLCPDLWDRWLTALAQGLAQALFWSDEPIELRVTGPLADVLPGLAEEIALWALPLMGDPAAQAEGLKKLTLPKTS